MEHEDARKRLKLADGLSSKTQATTSDSLPLLEQEVGPNASEDIESKERKMKEPKDRPKPHHHPHRRINKLVLPKPFPMVPTSVSATGPRSRDYQGFLYPGGFWVGYSRVRVWVGNLDPHQTPTPIRGWWDTQGHQENVKLLSLALWYLFSLNMN